MYMQICLASFHPFVYFALQAIFICSVCIFFSSVSFSYKLLINERKPAEIWKKKTNSTQQNQTVWRTKNVILGGSFLLFLHVFVTHWTLFFLNSYIFLTNRLWFGFQIIAAIWRNVNEPENIDYFFHILV